MAPKTKGAARAATVPADVLARLDQARDELEHLELLTRRSVTSLWDLGKMMDSVRRVRSLLDEVAPPPPTPEAA